MLDEMTLSKGKPWLSSLSALRCSSALIASSPRTAYWTFKRDGFTESRVNGRMVVKVAMVEFMLFMDMLRVWMDEKECKGRRVTLHGLMSI